MHVFQVMMTGSQGFLVWFNSGLFASNTIFFFSWPQPSICDKGCNQTDGTAQYKLPVPA